MVVDGYSMWMNNLEPEDEAILLEEYGTLRKAYDEIACGEDWEKYLYDPEMDMLEQLVDNLD